MVTLIANIAVRIVFRQVLIFFKPDINCTARDFQSLAYLINGFAIFVSEATLPNLFIGVSLFHVTSPKKFIPREPW